MDNKISPTFKSLSKSVFFDPEKCNSTEMSSIISHSGNPKFLSLSLERPFKTTVIKLGNTHGFRMQRNIASFLDLSKGTPVQLILRHPNNETQLLIPTREEIDRIYDKYQYYFRLPRNTKLSDFDFKEVGNKFYIPIYTKLSEIGSSFAFFVAIDVLTLFGFKLGDDVEILIRKV